VFKWVVIPLLLIVMMLRRPQGIMGSRELTDVFPRLRAFLQTDKEVEGYAPASD
jgi:branched-chain amino acid transport system permease protein